MNLIQCYGMDQQDILKIKIFLKGTMSIAENISKNTQEKSLISVLGGGDTLAAINKSKTNFFFLTYQQQVVHF